MDYVKAVILLAILLVLVGGSKVAYDVYIEAGTTTSSTSSTSSSTTSIPSTTTTTTTSTTTTSTTTYVIVYTTTMWGNCFDSIKNQNELGVDCGGVCKPCEVTCTEDSDCGRTHEERTVCINNTVYKPLVEYKCLNPWMVNATCRVNKRFILVDQCAVSERCVTTNFCTGEQCIESRCLEWPYEVCKWIDC